MDRNLLCGLVDEKQDIFAEISDKIWEYAEPAFYEKKSMEVQVQCLEKEGF